MYCLVFQFRSSEYGLIYHPLILPILHRCGDIHICSHVSYTTSSYLGSLQLDRSSQLSCPAQHKRQVSAQYPKHKKKKKTIQTQI